MSEHLALVLIGADGARWDIEGPDQGDQGVFLMPKVQQFYDSPAQTYWIKSGGAGQKYQGMSYKRRDPLFTLCSHGVSAATWQDIDSDLRISFGEVGKSVFYLEATNLITSEVRLLSMRMLSEPTSYEGIPDIAGRDPHLFATGSLMIDAACEQPHWYRDPIVGDGVASWTLPSGTSGSTSTFPHPGNPGDVPVWPRWYLNAPATWTIPDKSYGQELEFQRTAGADTNKTFPVVPLLSGENIDINSNEDEEFMRTIDGGIGPWMRSNGSTLVYPVKPHTAPHNVTVAVTAATTGVTATLEVDRWYTRPWGVSL